jgi:hypothetical protein
MPPMSRLSTVFVGLAVACAMAVPSVPALAAPGAAPVLVAKAKPKKKPAKKKPGKKPTKEAGTPAIEKGMKVVTMADATIVAEPEEGAKTIFSASEGQVLTVVKVQKKWVRVKNSDGKQGWVQAAEVVPKEVYDAKAEDEGGGGGGDEGGGDEGDETEKKPPKEEETARTDEGGGDEGGGSDEGEGKKKRKKGGDEGEEGGASVGVSASSRAAFDGKWRVALGAQVIGLIRSQEFSSGGAQAYSNYTINVNSPGAQLVGRVTHKSGKLEYGVQAGGLLTFGNGGVTVGSGAGAEKLAWSETAFEGDVLVGYHVSDGYLLSARLGYRLQTINIDNSPTIKQPSEVLGGVALGAEVLAYGFSPKLEIHVGAETLLAAALTQTDTLKDGDASTVTPIYVFVDVGYLISKSLQIVGSYQLGYESYSWTGPSQRDPDPAAQNAKRTDLQHTFAIGAQYWF